MGVEDLVYWDLESTPKQLPGHGAGMDARCWGDNFQLNIPVHFQMSWCPLLVSSVQCVPRLHIHAGLRGTWISLCFELSLLIHHPETHLQSRMGFIEPFS